MSYFKKLMFMMKLENRSIEMKVSWVFAWIFIPTLFREEYNSEKLFKDNLQRRWL